MSSGRLQRRTSARGSWPRSRCCTSCPGPRRLTVRTRRFGHVNFRIPTHKTRVPDRQRDGERYVPDEWNGLNATIEPGESEPTRRRRILRKRQLIVDLLYEVKAWMKVYVETEPEIGGALFRPFNKGGKHGGQEQEP